MGQKDLVARGDQLLPRQQQEQRRRQQQQFSTSRQEQLEGGGGWSQQTKEASVDNGMSKAAVGEGQTSPALPPPPIMIPVSRMVKKGATLQAIAKRLQQKQRERLNEKLLMRGRGAEETEKQNGVEAGFSEGEEQQQQQQQRQLRDRFTALSGIGQKEFLIEAIRTFATMRPVEANMAIMLTKDDAVPPLPQSVRTNLTDGGR